MRPKWFGPGPEAPQPVADRAVEPVQHLDLLRADRHAVLPPAPARHRPERAVVVPGEAGEPQRPAPALHVLVHPRGDRAEHLERGRQPRSGLLRLGARQELEVHDVARVAAALLLDREHAVAGPRGDHVRCLDPGLLAQRLEPVELRGDRGAVVVAVPVHAKDRADALVRVVHGEGRVLADVDQGERRVGRERRTPPGHASSPAEPLEDLLLGRLRQVVQALGPCHDSLPSTASSTRVISSRALTTDAVGPLM